MVGSDVAPLRDEADDDRFFRYIDEYLRERPELYARAQEVLQRLMPSGSSPSLAANPYAEAQAFVDALFEWVDLVRRKAKLLSGYILIWYAKTHEIEKDGDPAVAELIKARLDPEALDEVDLSIKRGWMNPDIIRGAWKAREKFKTWCRERHGERFDVQLRSVFPPLHFHSGHSDQSWFRQHERGLSVASQTILVFGAWLMTETLPQGRQADASAVPSGPVGSASALGESGANLGATSQATVGGRGAGPCGPLEGFALRACLADEASQLESTRPDEAVSLYRAAIATTYEPIEVPAEVLQRSHQSKSDRPNYYLTETRELRHALAALLSRHRRDQEAADVLWEELSARWNWPGDNWPLRSVAAEDCWLGAALYRRAGDFERARLITESCEVPPWRWQLFGYERARVLVETDDPDQAIGALGHVVESLLPEDPEIPARWSHIANRQEMIVTATKLLSQVMDKAVRSGKAIRVGDVVVYDEELVDGTPTPRVMVDLWRVLQRPCVRQLASPEVLLGQRWSFTFALPKEEHDPFGKRLKSAPNPTGAAFPVTRFVLDVHVPHETCFDVAVSANACHLRGELVTGKECEGT